MSPQQMPVPCGVRVGDEGEVTAPKPLSLLCRPPGRAAERGSAAPALSAEISNPAGVARGKERGKAWQSGRLPCLSGAFSASPSHLWEVCPQGWPGCAAQGAGGEGLNRG